MSPIPQSSISSGLSPFTNGDTQTTQAFYQNPYFIAAVVAIIVLLLFFLPPQPGCAPSADLVVPYPTSSFVAGGPAPGHGDSSLLVPHTDLTEHHRWGCNIGPPLRIRMGALSVHPMLLVDIGKNLFLRTIASVPHHGMEILDGPPTEVRRFNHHPWTLLHRRRHTKARREIRDEGVSWIL
ncbi:hypothetical protein F5141DRAFT_609854 [Pisolithus sp. B1]|nr:hypothetical protein F5141DRAFT_609854 [Pisolithus sp. B1]